MKVLVEYSQEFMGEILDDKFISFVNNDDEINKIYEDLYSDHHVFFVNVIKLGEENDI